MKANKIKIILGVLALIPTTFIARGGRGGHAGHHASGMHHSAAHNGTRNRHYSHGMHEMHQQVRHDAGHHPYGNRGYHWHDGRNWAWGHPGWWTWGATAAIIGSNFYWGGYSIEEWQQMATQDEEKMLYYQKYVAPAYKQFQNNPDTVPVRQRTMRVAAGSNE